MSKKPATKNTVDEVAAQVRAILVERFPKCFMPKGAPKLPLAIHIGHDLERAVPDFSWRHLHWALGDYTHGPTYYRACTDGAPRYGLNGEVSGEVLQSEAEYSAAQLAKIPPRKVKDAPAEEAQATAA